MIPYRVDVDLDEILKYFNSNNLYSQVWIQYCWDNKIIFKNPQEIKKKHEIFRVGYFQNCKLHLLGFEDDKLEEILGNITLNKGSIYQLNHIHSSDCIVIIPNDFKEENFTNNLKEIPKEFLKNIVYEDWYIESKQNDYLSEIEQYRASLNGCYEYNNKFALEKCGKITFSMSNEIYFEDYV